MIFSSYFVRPLYITERTPRDKFRLKFTALYYGFYYQLHRLEHGFF